MARSPRTGSSATTKRGGTTNVQKLAEHAAASAQVQALRASNLRLARQLAVAKLHSEELVAAVYQAASDAASALALTTATLPAASCAPTKTTPETALVVVSDLQLAKITATYNSDVCAERMQRYAEKIIAITNIQRTDHPIREARIYLLGDIVEGELIFPMQAHLIDASLYNQVMERGPKILSEFFSTLLAHFDTLHVVGVIGNHGQIGGQSRAAYNPTTNADRMLYRFVQAIFDKEPRITFHIPARERERDWYAVDYPHGPKGKGFLLFHGDQIRGGFAGFPFYGAAKKIWGWRSGAIAEPFDYAIFGHWHTPTRMTLNAVTAYCNGSSESSNTYAQEQLAACGRPTQLLLFSHPKRGVTAEYWVNLE